MKATGEVMAIERNFGAALNKALRGLEQTGAGWLSEHPEWAPELDRLASDLMAETDQERQSSRRYSGFCARPTPSVATRSHCCAAASPVTLDPAATGIAPVVRRGARTADPSRSTSARRRSVA